jgi:imidazole glycerol-phosphate synthase subunit HisH
MLKKKILILNYGAGNYQSIKNALSKFNCLVEIGNEVNQLKKSEIIILPGVGTFPSAVNFLKKKNIYNHLIKLAHKGKKILGICLGMQLLAKNSNELINTNGLNLVSGSIKGNINNHHIGWNKISITKKSIFKSLNDKYFYFQHSYNLENNFSKDFGLTFDSKKIKAFIVEKNIVGVQFHPEKSQSNGDDFFKIYLDKYL